MSESPPPYAHRYTQRTPLNVQYRATTSQGGQVPRWDYQTIPAPVHPTQFAPTQDRKAPFLTWKLVAIIIAVLICGTADFLNMRDPRSLVERERQQLALDRLRRTRSRERDQAELERIERERELKALRRKEHEEMMAMKNTEAGIFWNAPLANECVAYGIRRYNARLSDVPANFDKHAACFYTSVMIHNRTIDFPNQCDDQGSKGVYGHWLVGFNETACKPYWGDISRKGDCFGIKSGTRRFEARLWNLRKGDNWDELCGTTAAVILGNQYPGPNYCEWRGGWSLYGIWEIGDSSCL